jgi:septal ring factor EnvC (AmiA/AmiB activator)
MNKIRITLAALVALILLCAVHTGDWKLAMAQEADSDEQIQTQRQELENIRRELAEQRKEAEKLEREESTAAEKLAQIEAELATTKRLLRKLERQDKSLSKQLKELESELDVSAAALASRQESVAGGVREMYKQWRYRYMEILFSDSSLPGILGRYRHLALLSHRQAQGVASTLEHRNELGRNWEKVQDNYREVLRLRAEKEKEDKRLAQLVKRRKETLNEIRRKKESHLSAIATLEKTREEIERLINLLERRRLTEDEEGFAGLSFPTLRGLLEWPVSGDLIGTFGRTKHKRFGTTTFSSGIDIRAPEGSPVTCVAEGIVEYVSWLPGYGNCIIVNHGDGYYTLYAHALDVLVQAGNRVTAGGTIATVGDTGSMKGVCLHFEVREGADPVDPLRWLRTKGD